MGAIVRSFEKAVCYCGALVLPGSGFAVPRLSLLRDTLSRGAESRRHPRGLNGLFKIYMIYWSRLLGKTSFWCQKAKERGGEL